MKRKRKWLWIGAGLSLLVVGIAAAPFLPTLAAMARAVANGEAADGATAPTLQATTPTLARDTRRAVKVWSIFPIELVDVQKLPATVEAYDDIDLGTNQAGVIKCVHREEGAVLKKGDPLYQLDVDDLQARYDQTQVAYDLAKKQYDRIKQMRESKIVVADVYDQALSQLRTTSATMRLAKVMLDRGTIRAPIDGILDRRPVDLGEYITPGQVVAKIVNISRVKIMIDVPEKDVQYYAAGGAVEIVLHKRTDRETIVPGKIEFVSRTSDNAALTYPVKVVIDNKKRLMRPGMIVDVRMTRRKQEQALAVPYFCIINRADGEGGKDEEYVFVEVDGFARKAPVERGIISSGLIEVKAPPKDELEEGEHHLQEGDNLIFVGHRELVDGEGISVKLDATSMVRALVDSGKDLSMLALEIMQSGVLDD